jgi:hypothetical protein
MGVVVDHLFLLLCGDCAGDSTPLDRCRGEVKTRVVRGTETAPQAGYVPVNGLQLYYEVHGAGGIPLLLRMAGCSTSICSSAS